MERDITDSLVQHTVTKVTVPGRPQSLHGKKCEPPKKNFLLKPQSNVQKVTADFSTGTEVRVHCVNKFWICNWGLTNFNINFTLHFKYTYKNILGYTNYYVPNHAQSGCNSLSRSDNHRPQDKKRAKICITMSNKQHKLWTPTILLTFSRTYNKDTWKSNKHEHIHILYFKWWLPSRFSTS